MSHVDGWYDEGNVRGDTMRDPLPWREYSKFYGVEVVVDTSPDTEWCGAQYPTDDCVCRLPKGHDCPHWPVYASHIREAGPDVGVVNIRSMSRQ